MLSRSQHSGENNIDSQLSPESLEVNERLSTSQAAIHQDNWAESIPSSDFANNFKSMDWSETVLGPLKQWTFALRMHTFVLFADQRPGCILWFEYSIAYAHYNANAL